VFLNVAAFSIYIIVIRKNVLAIIRPQMDSDKISKTTVLTTAILLIVILIISFVLKNQIQTALNFTGGIFGCLILFIMPSLVVYKARKLFPTPKSFLNSYVWMPLAVVAIGVASLTFNLYQTISNLVK
jgi:amino acid permease